MDLSKESELSIKTHSETAAFFHHQVKFWDSQPKVWTEEASRLRQNVWKNN